MGASRPSSRSARPGVPAYVTPPATARSSRRHVRSRLSAVARNFGERHHLAVSTLLGLSAQRSWERSTSPTSWSPSRIEAIRNRRAGRSRLVGLTASIATHMTAGDDQARIGRLLLPRYSTSELRFWRAARDSNPKPPGPKSGNHCEAHTTPIRNRMSCTRACRPSGGCTWPASAAAVGDTAEDRPLRRFAEPSQRGGAALWRTTSSARSRCRPGREVAWERTAAILSSRMVTALAPT